MGADLLLPLYFAVIVRQFLWGIQNEFLAWGLTCFLTVALWVLHLKFKDGNETRLPGEFWLIVAMPLLLVYLLRLAFPDISFDVLNHRLVQSERALRGFLFIKGDFYPSFLPFNPAPEILTGIFRHLFGYRLGTIISYLAVLWAGAEVEKLLRPYVASKRWRCAAVLLVLFTEYLLFEINNYVGDLLPLPLFVAAIRRTLDLRPGEVGSRYEAFYIALLLGIGAAFKLTNLLLMVPVLLLYGFRIFFSRDITMRSKALTVAGALVAFLVPVLPHTVYIYRLTQSPVFPLYNRVIRSPYWPPINLGDGRWGPKTMSELLLWPMVSAFQPARLSELGVYAGRLCAVFIVALIGLIVVRKDSRLRWLCFITVSCSVLWSLTAGYIRYGINIEIIGGVVTIAFCAHLSRRLAKPVLKAIVISPVLALLIVQGIWAGRYVLQYEWSMRPTVVTNREEYFSELRFLFRDRDLIKFQTAQNVSLIENVGTWIVSDVKTNGIEVLLKPEIPMLAVNNPVNFDMPASRRQFAQALQDAAGTRMYSLAFSEDLNLAVEAIKKRGLGAGNVTPIELRFFSNYLRLPLSLIEVLPRRKKTAEEQLRDLTANPILPDDDYVAQLSSTQQLSVLRPGEKVSLTVRVKNASESLWIAKGDTEGRHSITLRNRWLNAGSGEVITEQDGGVVLSRNLLPGEEVDLPITVTAPAQPGNYILDFDMVQEQVSWFHQKGSQTLRFNIRVGSQ